MKNVRAVVTRDYMLPVTATAEHCRRESFFGLVANGIATCVQAVGPGACARDSNLEPTAGTIYVPLVEAGYLVDDRRQQRVRETMSRPDMVDTLHPAARVARRAECMCHYNAGMSLLDVCATHYGLIGYSLRPLAGGVTEHTYLLEHPSALPFVLRVETIGMGGMPANEGVLLALEAQGYPAPRVVRTRDGAARVQVDGMMLVVTTFVEGKLVDSEANTPESLYGIGRAIGRLHALALTALPEADFMSTERVVEAQQRLHSLEGRVPPEARSRFDEICRLLAETPSFTETAGCLIHNDCHPGNAIQRPDGEIVLIDWDGAGHGHPALDLGFLLVAADTYTPDVPAVGTSDERVHAIVDGYSEWRLPDPRELQALGAAICYRVALINARGMAHRIERGEHEKIEEWWWNGCEVAESLAGRARRRFDKHRRHDSRVVCPESEQGIRNF